ncbi:MAG: N-formylglutamate amidohydrolase [Rhodospirillaceae bacterium]|nr:N-formylglutamate amidohydrolase [Alphaproteobacteria bacterium]MBR71411.1 N-formylglutamate amidohydrolase [Rhodospirillaceae bacterium]|tara:strand:- start:924 stop:1766 length:843 start_codon:yes stop_codon:yes gene_type:complete
MADKSFTFSAENLLDTEPEPFTKLDSLNSRSVWFVTCDHASNLVPKHMNNLGITSTEMNRHIGWDIGALGVAKELSKILDARLISGNYSRLIVDLNRPTSSPTFIPKTADGTPIPANINISEKEKKERTIFFHKEYHLNIEKWLDRLILEGVIPVIIAIHSFTPVFQNFRRPWHIGLLYEHDQRFVLPLRNELLLRNSNLIIGDNQPYAIRGPSDFTIPVHGQARGLPHIEIEVRQDLIEIPENQKIWAHILASALLSVIENNQPFGIINNVDRKSHIIS